MTPLMTPEEVAVLFKLKVSTIWRRCEEGRMFPPPVQRRPYRFSALQVQQVLDGTLREPERQTGRRKYFTRVAAVR